MLGMAVVRVGERDVDENVVAYQSAYISIAFHLLADPEKRPDLLMGAQASCLKQRFIKRQMSLCMLIDETPEFICEAMIGEESVVRSFEEMTSILKESKLPCNTNKNSAERSRSTPIGISVVEKNDEMVFNHSW
jgi:hypothetical protein